MYRVGLVDAEQFAELRERDGAHGVALSEHLPEPRACSRRRADRVVKLRLRIGAAFIAGEHTSSMAGSGWRGGA